jgi:type II secretory ATPase GspE/PulE/Tfp pilus assembly ATPase PilB-like protein
VADIEQLIASEQHDRLFVELEKMGKSCPDADSVRVGSLAEAVGAANGVDSKRALQWLAEQFGIMPMDLARPVCSTKAEQMFRKLARQNVAPDPWMPFGTVGLVLLCAHFDPSAEEAWGIPDFLYSKILVSSAQYEALKSDVAQRISMNPLPESTLLEFVEGPAKGGGLLTALKWILEHYPMSKSENDKLSACESAFGNIDMRRASDYKLLPRDFGVAFNFMTSGRPIFAPELAPMQDFFPDNLLEKHTVFPVYRSESAVYLMAADRQNYSFEDEWYSTGSDSLKIIKVLADPEGIREVISRNRGRSTSGGSTIVDVGDLAYADDANLVDIDPSEMQQINPSNINTSPEQIIQWVLYQAISRRASDLHVEKYFNTARLRARIDGELHVIHSGPDEILPRLVSLLKNYSNMGQRRQTAEDGRFSMRIGQRRIDCRVSAIPCSKALQKITIRFLDKKDGIKELSELNLSPRQSSIIKDTLGRDQGLVLVTGPTGSGKTTSLYAFINSIISETINIHTVEDPIEYEIEGINQTQTDPINGIDFGEGLRRILRADPDVILIGESRDEETASAAVNAALTGHLVLTTLHANDSLRAVSRLISMGVAPYLLADSLALSQAQRLVRRLCVQCKRPVAVTDAIRETFNKNKVPLSPETAFLYHPAGCPECNDAGYSGRIALMEMCVVDMELSEMIARNAPQSQMREVAQRAGVLSLYQEGLLQVIAGQTTLAEIACLSYTAVGD